MIDSRTIESPRAQSVTDCAIAPDDTSQEPASLDNQMTIPTTSDVVVLIVDDDPDVGAETLEYLRFKGLTCELAPRGARAIAQVEANPAIGVILADIHMAGMSGLEMLRHLKRYLPADRQIETVMLSGNANRDHAIEALKVGAMDFLIKPVEPATLYGAAMRAIESVRHHHKKKHYEAALCKALDVARETNRLHTEFMSTVSHEFRTPLAVIDAAAQRLFKKHENCSPEEIERRSNSIRNSVTRLIDMIDKNLTVARIEEQGIEFTPEECDLPKIVNDVISKQKSISPGYNFECQNAGLPKFIQGDPGLLDQIFTNLISNAVKYSPANQHVDIVGAEVNGNAVISVRDHGVGIPKNEIDRLFQRFFRASTSSGIPGSGIGLHLCRNLIELHRGEIRVESVVGSGTTITVSLPVVQPSSQNPTGYENLGSNDDEVASDSFARIGM